MKCSCLVFMMIGLAMSAFNLVANYSFVNSVGTPAPALSYDATSEYIITSILNPITNQVLILIPNLTSNPPTFTTSYSPTPSQNPYQYRTNPASTLPLQSTNSTAFLPTSTLHFTSLNTLAPYSSISLTLFRTIVDCILVGGSTDVILLMDGTPNFGLVIGRFDSGGAFLGEVGVGWPSFQTLMRGIQRNGKLYILFSDGVLIYYADIPLGEIMRFLWPSNSNSQMDILGNLMACSSGYNITIYDLTSNFNLIFSRGIGQPIYSIKFYSLSEILVMTVTGIYRYDIPTATIIETFTTPFSASDALDITWSQYMVLYKKFPQNYSYLLIYNLGVPVNATNGTIQTLIGADQKLQKDQLWFLKQGLQYCKVFSENLGFAMHISSLRLTTSSLFMLVVILDDLQYYQYHKTTYPQSIQFSITNVNTLNKVRLDSWFFQDSLIQKYLQKNWQQSETIYQAFFPNDEKNPTQFYFLNAARSAYVNNFVMCLVGFFGMRGCCLGVCFLGRRWRIFRGVWKWLRLNTKWWMLLAAFFENNMASLTFCCFVQLQGPMVSCFNFDNKVNLALSVLTLFCLIFYSLCFYLIIYSKSPKKQSKVLLNENSCTADGFFWQSFCRITRNLIRCFFHGFFIFNYKMQIVGLACSNVLYVVATVVFGGSFSSSVVFVVYLGYFVGFLGFDVGLCIKYLVPSIFKKIRWNLTTFILICILIGLGLILLIFSILKALTIFIKKSCKITKQKKEGLFNKTGQLVNTHKQKSFNFNKQKKLVILIPARKVKRMNNNNNIRASPHLEEEDCGNKQKFWNWQKSKQNSDANRQNIRSKQLSQQIDSQKPKSKLKKKHDQSLPLQPKPQQQQQHQNQKQPPLKQHNPKSKHKPRQQKNHQNNLYPNPNLYLQNNMAVGKVKATATKSR